MSEDEIRLEYYITLKNSKTIDLNSVLYRQLTNEIMKTHRKLVKNNVLLHNVSKSLNADELINSLGTPDVDNEYIVKPDTDGTWWMEHKHVGSGEPLKQWLTGKP